MGRLRVNPSRAKLFDRVERNLGRSWLEEQLVLDIDRTTQGVQLPRFQQDAIIRLLPLQPLVQDGIEDN